MILNNQKRLAGVILVVLVFPLFAQAQGYEPGPFERAPAGEVQCSWSTMKHQEYQQCLSRRRHFGAMSDEEKKLHNEEVDKRVTEQRLQNLERRSRRNRRPRPTPLPE